MTRLRAFLVTVTLLAVGCGGQRFPVDAVGTLRAAARHETHRRYWHTDYYERRDDRWQVIWSHATEIT